MVYKSIRIFLCSCILILIPQTAGAVVISANISSVSIDNAITRISSTYLNSSNVPKIFLVTSANSSVLPGNLISFSASLSPNPNGGTLSLETNGNNIQGCVAQNILATTNSYLLCSMSFPPGQYKIQASFSGYNQYLQTTSNIISINSINTTNDTTTSTTSSTTTSTLLYNQRSVFKNNLVIQTGNNITATIPVSVKNSTDTLKILLTIDGILLLVALSLLILKHKTKVI